MSVADLRPRRELSTALSKGLGWNSLANGVRAAGQSFAAVIYALFLTPGEFGTIGLLLIIMALLAVLQDAAGAGFAIFARDLEDQDFSDLFWCNLALAVGSASLLFVFSGSIAELFHEPRLTNLLKIVALVHVLRGGSALHRAILHKYLRFNTIAKIEIGAVLLGVCTGITVTALGGGLLGVVAQAVIVTGLSGPGFWLAARWRPTFSFKGQVVSRALRYSGNLSACQLLGFAAQHGDAALIARYLGSTDLGFYTFAYRITAVPVVVIAHALAATALPALAAFQDRVDEFRQIFLELARTAGFICFPVLAGLFVVADDLVPTFLGPEWMPMTTILKILCPVAAVQSLSALSTVIFPARGRTDLLLKWALVAVPVTLASVAYGLQWGTVGVAAGLAIAYVGVLAYPGFWLALRLIGLSVPGFFRALAPAFFSSLLMAVCVATLQHALLQDLGSELRLALSIVFGVVAYLLLSLVLNGEKLLQVLRFQFVSARGETPAHPGARGADLVHEPVPDFRTNGSLTRRGGDELVSH